MGDQHIYLYQPLNFSLPQLRKKIADSELSNFLERANAYEFPDKLTLTTISLTSESVSFLWHKGNIGWTRAKIKDYQKNEGLDLFEYRAYRYRSDREVVRFEWQFDKDYSAIYIQQPLKGSLHDEIQKSVWAVLSKAGVIDAPLSKVSLNGAANNLIDSPEIISTSAKRLAEGGYVEYGVTTSEGGIEDVAAVSEVNQAIDANNFSSTTGRFKLDNKKHPSLSKPLKLELFGNESRIRIWVQCNREDVYFVTDLAWQHN